MEQLNRIELKGIVGSVRIQEFPDNRKMARINLATSYAYKDRAGNAIIDTDWHTVIAWESDRMPRFEYITKGTKLHVIGRLKVQHYTGADGTERIGYEVQASRIAVIDTDEVFQSEM